VSLSTLRAAEHWQRNAGKSRSDSEVNTPAGLQRRPRPRALLQLAAVTGHEWLRSEIDLLCSDVLRAPLLAGARVDR
jgi:hypothetical protein